MLAINRSDAFTFSGVISGTGAFNQIGSGTTTLSGANTYTGATTVTAPARLTIAAGGSITSNVSNNATFNNAGTVTGSVTTRPASIRHDHQWLTNAGALNTGTVNGGLTTPGSSTANRGRRDQRRDRQQCAARSTSRYGDQQQHLHQCRGATLAVGAGGTYTLQGLLTNSGAVTVASGGQLIATAAASPTMPAAPSRSRDGTVKDDLNNAGTVTNNGAYFANVATNTGTITNSGTWTGNVVSNTGTINNNLTWTGTVSNAGTFNNNAGATVSGLLTNTAGIP